jgi:hypothetical protein
VLVQPGPLWSPAVVLVVVGLVAGGRWARIVLTDADRYVTATSHLPASPVVRRLSGWVSARLLVRTARRRGVDPALRRLGIDRRVAAAVPRTMARPGFSVGWSLGQRVLHDRAARARREAGFRRIAGRRGPVASRPLVVALAMLVLAATGEVAGRVERRSRRRER